MSDLPTLLIATGDLNTLGMLRQACRDEYHVLEGAASGADARSLAAEHEPALAIVDMALPGGSPARLIRDLLEQDSSILIVALVAEDDAETARPATVAGARDYLAPPLDAGKIREVVGRVLATRTERLEALERARERDMAGGIWSFASASGGCGQTTLLLSMAHELAAVGTKVAVVDLDWLFADASFYLGVDPKGPTIHELLQESHPTDPETLSAYLRTHPTGIQILADPPRATDAASLDPGAVLEVVLGLRGVCDYLLLDLPVGIGDLQLPYLDASSFVFVTSTGTIAAMKNMRRMVEVLLEAGLRKGRLRPVLTAFREGEVDPAPFHRTLERLDSGLAGIFPWDQEAAEDAVHMGQPVTRLYPRSPFTRAVRKFLAPVLERTRPPTPPEDKRGFLARLFS